MIEFTAFLLAIDERITFASTGRLPVGGGRRAL
jgi:hypothetical protein